MYDDIPFNESDMSVAINRSMSSNSNWIFLHTNLNGAIQWLEDDNWEKQDSGVYIYPIATDDGKYKNIEVGIDSDDFPILRAGLMVEGTTFGQ